MSLPDVEAIEARLKHWEEGLEQLLADAEELEIDSELYPETLQQLKLVQDLTSQCVKEKREAAQAVEAWRKSINDRYQNVLKGITNSNKIARRKMEAYEKKHKPVPNHLPAQTCEGFTGETPQ